MIFKDIVHNENSLNLEVLNSQYENLKAEYNQSITDYLFYLNNEDIDTDKCAQFKGDKYDVSDDCKNKYINGYRLKTNRYENTLNMDSIDDCSHLCSQNSKCQGATYNSKDNQCKLHFGRHGLYLRNIKKSSINNSVILSNLNYLLLKIQKINKELIKINNKIRKIIRQKSEKFNRKHNPALKRQYKELNDAYEELLYEKGEVSKGLKENENVNNIGKETKYSIYQKSYTLFIFTIIFMFSIYQLIKLNSTYNNTIENNSSIIINVVLMLSFIVWIMIINKFKII